MHPTGSAVLNRRLGNNQSGAFLEHELTPFQIGQLPFIYWKFRFIAARAFKCSLVKIIVIGTEVNAHYGVCFFFTVQHSGLYWCFSLKENQAF